jgi:hypothetical protein
MKAKCVCGLVFRIREMESHAASRLLRRLTREYGLAYPLQTTICPACNRTLGMRPDENWMVLESSDTK